MVHLFFAKIHFANYLYAFIRSWFCTVHYAEAKVPKTLLNRFQAVYYEEVFSTDDWVRLRDATWTEWVSIVSCMPSSRWTCKLFNQTVDFHRIALQHLSQEFLVYRRLTRYAASLNLQDARIAESAPIWYLRNLCLASGLEWEKNVGSDRAAWLFDLVGRWGRNVGWVGYLVLQALSALRGGPAHSIDVLHEGLAHSESGRGPRELSFLWIQERRICASGRVLFILACPPKHASDAIVLRHALLLGLGWKTAVIAVWNGARTFFSYLMKSFRFESVMLAEFGLRCVAPYLLVNRRKIRTYLTTNSACLPEHPSVALYNAIGVRTILWTYGANMALFNHRYLSDERHFYTSHMETAECWLWSEHHLSLWLKGRILPSRTQFRLIGPAMMGDASPCLMSPAESRQWFLGLHDAAPEPWKYIAVFDINPANKEGQKVLQLGPLIITEELVESFYQHLIFLLEAFPDVRLLVKTKRHDHPYKIKPPAQKRLVDPSGEWVRTGRVIDLDPDTNPYIPIGVADLTIGLPFSSPILAGLHFGRRGIYHDPLGLAVEHHYHELDEIISHSYEDLEKKVRYWLYECREETFKAFINRPETRQFLGPQPGVDPAEEFGKALWGEEFRLAHSDRDGVVERNTWANLLPIGSRSGM